MYVWVDALTNYITATGFPDENPRNKFWPADAHVIGKDITRFHAIYWPAFLMSAKLPLPKQIVVHGFLFNRGEKMSKSVGNVVSPADLVASLRPRSGALFLPARSAVRTGRQLFARGDRAADQRRSRQRSRQSRPALAVDDRARAAAASCRTGARAAAQPEDLALLARADALLRHRARAHEGLPAAPLSRRRVRGRRGGEPLFRQLPSPGSSPRAIRRAAAAVLYTTHRDAAHRRDPAAARHAGSMGKTARPARRRPRARGPSPTLEQAGRGLEGAAPAEAGHARCRRPSPIFPRYVEPSGRGGRGEADRQPLPSRLPRFRRGTRRRRRARQSGRRRAHGDDFDPRSRRRETGRDRRTLSRGLRSRSARIRIRRPRNRRRTRPPSARFAAHPKCVGIGEAGLDYHYNYAPRRRRRRGCSAPRSAWRASFELPLVIHAREADDDVAAILREEMAAGAFTAVLHCFTSSRALAETGLELGLYVSFSGVLTFKNSKRFARDRARRAARSGAGRNRRAVSGANAASRPAQRAVLRRRDRARARRDEGRLRPTRSPPRRAPIRCGCLLNWARRAGR